MVIIQDRREFFEFGDAIACCGQERDYHITPEDERFLMLAYTGQGDGSPVRRIDVVLNWFEELERLAPTQ